MALPASNTSEGGSNGGAITPANSGGASGTAFDLVTAGTGASVTYSSTRAAHGGLSAAFLTGGSAARATAQWGDFAGGGVLGSCTEIYGRFYFYLTGYPSANEIIANFWNHSTVVMQIMQLSTGYIVVQDSAFTPVLSFFHQTPLNQWNRVEFHATFPGTATGLVNVKLFTSMDSNIVTEEQGPTAAAQNFASLPCQSVAFGWSNFVTSNPVMYMDDLQLQAGGWAGPVVTTDTAAPQVLYSTALMGP